MSIVFKFLKEGEEPPPGFQNIQCHTIFTIKMEDFMHKARLVTGGHTTETPK